jgi:hypothetical protein
VGDQRLAAAVQPTRPILTSRKTALAIFAQKRDDEIRLSKSLADEIELRLAAFFADKK